MYARSRGDIGLTIPDPTRGDQRGALVSTLDGPLSWETAERWLCRSRQRGPHPGAVSRDHGRWAVPLRQQRTSTRSVDLRHALPRGCGGDWVLAWREVRIWHPRNDMPERAPIRGSPRLVAADLQEHAVPTVVRRPGAPLVRVIPTVPAMLRSSSASHVITSFRVHDTCVSARRQAWESDKPYTSGSTVQAFRCPLRAFCSVVQAAQSQATRSDPLPLGCDPCREGGTQGAHQRPEPRLQRRRGLQDGPHHRRPGLRQNRKTA